ncbi:MAG: flagellar export chaperone FlgN [Bacteroidota bacterium]
MNTKELVQSLSNQEKNFDRLISVLLQKKEAIVANDFDQLDERIKNEQTILGDIDAEERKRKNLIESFAKNNSIVLENFTFDELFNTANKLFVSEQNNIEKLRTSIKDKAGRIININSQLTLLIDVSRNIVKERMMTLLGNGKRSLVNKRI